MKMYIIQFLLFFFYENVDEPTKKGFGTGIACELYFFKYVNEKSTAGNTMQ